MVARFYNARSYRRKCPKARQKSRTHPGNGVDTTVAIWPALSMACLLRHKLARELLKDARKYVTAAPEEVPSDRRRHLRDEGLLSSVTQEA